MTPTMFLDALKAIASQRKELETVYEERAWLRAALEVLVDEMCDWPLQSPEWQGPLIERCRALLEEVPR